MLTKASNYITQVRFLIHDEDYKQIKNDSTILMFLSSSASEILMRTRMLLENVDEMTVPADGVITLPPGFLLIKGVYYKGEKVERAQKEIYFGTSANLHLSKPLYVLFKPNKLMLRGIKEGEKILVHYYSSVVFNSPDDEIFLPYDLGMAIIFKTGLMLYSSGRVDPQLIPASLLEVWSTEVERITHNYITGRIEEDEIKVLNRE